MTLLLNSHQTFAKKFFQPLRIHPIWTILASVIIGMALYVGIDIGLAEVVRQNSYPIHMLAAELLNELGPEYDKARKEHSDMMNEYIWHLEQRDYFAILRMLYPEYSPEKALASTREALEKAADEKEARDAIWQAGVASNKLYVRSKRFPKSPYKWFEYEVVSEELLRDLDNGFDRFHEVVDNLEKAQTLEDAVNECRNACRESRKVILLLSLTQLGYDNEERIERFLNDVERACGLAESLAQTEEYKSKQDLFLDRARNMKLRANVVEAILANDMDRVHDLLKKVIEIAIEKQKARVNE